MGLSEDKPKYHSYPTWIMRTAIILQVSQGLSYRQVQEVLRTILCIMCLTMSVPCPNTIRQWVQKYSKNELKKGEENEESKILVIDESIGMGQEKAFLILGVDAEDWAENPRSLKHEDTKVTGLQSKKSWKGPQIAATIKRVRGTVKYIVSDNGSVLKKACELADIVRVPDCTHYMGNLLKKHSTQSKSVQTLFTKMSKIRQQWGQTEYAPLITPNMRTKSKFLNMYAIVDWVKIILANWDNLDEKHQTKVSFLKEDEVCLQELICLVNTIKDLSELFKNKGITEQTCTEIQAIFAKKCTNYAALEKLKIDIIDYVEKIRASLPNESCILCCSDVIESYFGKYKNRNEKKASQGITQDILVASLFGADFCVDELKEAMESTSWADVNAWSKENLVPSMGEEKRNFWRKVSSKLPNTPLKNTEVCTG